MPLADIADYIRSFKLSILSIETHHVVAAAEPEPNTRDPFDRLLLAQCQAESLKLATADRALLRHPLALKI